VGAGWLSFLVIRDLAVLAGWPADKAWAVQPIVELFRGVGSLEIVCRAWEGRADLSYPKALIGAALAVVLAANVTDRLLRAAGTGSSASMLVLVLVLVWWVGWPGWYWPQLGSLHLMSGRLHALGGRTTTGAVTRPHRADGPDSRPTGPRTRWARRCPFGRCPLGRCPRVGGPSAAGRCGRRVTGRCWPRRWRRGG